MKNLAKKCVQIIKNPRLYILFVGAVFSPTIAQAATCDLGATPKLTDYIGYPVCLINKYLINGVIAVAILVFFIGVMRYIMNGGDAKKRLEGMEYIGYGLLALFVMLAVWGLIYVISGSLQIGIGGSIKSVPSFTS